ncbi:hypothetical protein NC651_033275 [Populus alba x Populus x berolinensis]|nr:hypothetical protein NC651_033275 [Populus alba x Populus x berolinensis]
MLFKNMLEQKVVPNGATFVGNFICLWLGMRFFYSRDEYYGVTPTFRTFAFVVNFCILNLKKFINS